MRDWQPIETAPRDGRRLLLAVIVPGFESEGKKVAIGAYDSHWTGQCWVWENSRIRVGTVPSEWQPMPEPPTATG